MHFFGRRIALRRIFSRSPKIGCRSFTEFRSFRISACPVAGGNPSIAISESTNAAESKIRMDRGIDTVGPPSGTWIIPKYQADKLQHQARSIGDMERNLGLPANTFDDQVRRFDIEKPASNGIRKPKPTEGNEFHRPNTGLTSSGQSERVIDTPKINPPKVSDPIDLPLKREAK